MEVDIQKVRRKVLKDYIRDVAELSVNAFAEKLDRQSSFFYEVFSGKRPFREQLAESLEKEIIAAKLPAVNLRKPDGMDVESDAWPWPFPTSLDDYLALDAIDRRFIEQTIEDRVKRHKDVTRPESGKKSARNR